jgi:hypothetical protein
MLTLILPPRGKKGPCEATDNLFAIIKGVVGSGGGGEALIVGGREIAIRSLRTRRNACPANAPNKEAPR